MESSYGVGVANRFAIPDEEDVEVDDPLDIIQSVEKKATEQKKEVKKPVAKGKAAEKPQQKSSSNDKTKGQNRGSDKPSQPRGDRGDRGERGDRGDRRERKPREGGERRPRREGGNNQSSSGFGEENSFGQDSSFGGETQSFGDRDASRGRGRGRGRGGPGGPRSGAPRDGRREYDRRSGSDRSGVRAQEKREGGGPRNWGNPVTDFGTSDDVPQTEQANEENATPAPVEGAEGEKPAEEAVPPAEDEDAKLMTLDEYKSLQQQSRYKTEVNVRKAGENEDQSKWKNTRRYERPAQVSDEDGVEYVIEKKDQRSHSRQTVDLNFQFNVDSAPRGPAPGGRRGRGGRGGGRGAPSGGRNFDGPRRERGPGGSYNFRDDDFPALG